MNLLDVVVMECQFLLTSIFVGVELSVKSPVASYYQLTLFFFVVSRLRHQFAHCVYPLAHFDFPVFDRFLGVCYLWSANNCRT